MGTLSQRSVLLDGSNEHILIGNVPALDFDRLTAWSVSAWVLLTGSNGTYCIFSKMQPSTAWRGWIFFVSNYELVVQHISDWGAGDRLQVGTTGVAISPGRWAHCVLTMDGTGTAAGVKFYVDGAEVTSKTTTYDALTATTVGTGLATIGRRNGGSDLHWPGCLDEVAAYSKALSAAEVTTLFNVADPPNLTVVGPTANLVGYWRVGDGDTYPTATDASSSGNNGTYTNTEATDIVLFGAGVQQISGTGFSFGAMGVGEEMFPAPSPMSIPFPSSLAATPYFKMRALASPGPGYETWVAAGAADYAGSGAGGPIQAGTAVVVATWED